VLSNNEVALWTSVAAAGGAVLAGSVTAYVTYRVTTRQVTSAETVAAQQRAHELQAAKEERDQERLLAAYTTIARAIVWWSDSIQWKLRSLRFETDPPEQPPEPQEFDSEAMALANLIASGTVGEMLQDFNRKRQTYSAALGHHHQIEQMLFAGGSPPDRGLVEQARQAREELRKAGNEVLAVVTQALEEMRSELGATGQLPTDI
jgi:hypothetical protein